MERYHNLDILYALQSIYTEGIVVCNPECGKLKYFYTAKFSKLLVETETALK